MRVKIGKCVQYSSEVSKVFRVKPVAGVLPETQRDQPAFNRVPRIDDGFRYKTVFLRRLCSIIRLCIIHKNIQVIESGISRRSHGVQVRGDAPAVGRQF